MKLKEALFKQMYIFVNSHGEYIILGDALVSIDDGVQYYTIDEFDDDLIYNDYTALLQDEHTIKKVYDEKRNLLYDRNSKDRFTCRDKEIAKALFTLGYNYIARDGDFDETLYVYDEKPCKSVKNKMWENKKDNCTQLKEILCLDYDRMAFENVLWGDDDPVLLNSVYQ